MNHNRGSFPIEETEIYNTNQSFISNSEDHSKLESFYVAKGKRLLDICLVLIGAPFVLPLMLLVALCVRLDGGPAIYKQKRVGFGGREFAFLKFRSMMIDADQIFQDHIRECPAAAAEWQARQKLENDPRVTKIGRFIRATSLDELPQLWNVLMGDMSLVGPRPMLPQQQSMYPGVDYNLLKPGITGLWQVSERNDVEFSDRAIFDSEYARKISLGLDLKILFQTVGAVCNRTGR